ncbi:MAG TPA: Vms1/Ankzf1 family peptidyl-tRNA hydrolase, partial [Methanomicrobiales archaeon]|nr:Vms1/Ankzf1 family peptidyl-tRNA hydrolase [Methanomicrobiales archaeon]
REARLFTVRSRSMREVERMSTDIMQKHKKGGMSQMRFSRLRQGSIHAFLKEVAEEVEKFERGEDLAGLVLAGPGEAKEQLNELLPANLHSRLLGVVDADMDTPSGDLMTIGDAATASEAEARGRHLVEELRRAILKGHLAAYGAEETRAALEAARVRTLILLDDFEIPGWICERCRLSDETPSRGESAQVRLFEDLYRLARGSGAEVAFVRDEPFLKSVGGVGAILRY